MIRAVVFLALVVIPFHLLCNSKAVLALSRQKRHSQHPSEITVTLKLEWNATIVGKSIPAGFTTKVTNGTVLIDVLNKAADAGNQGPFSKYDTTYYKGLGYAITAMNGIKQDHGTATYWAIIDGKTGGGIPCGISSYVPASNSITVFRFTQTFGHSGPVSGYCKTAAPSSNQITSPITVTIGLHWDISSIGKPIPAPYTTQVTAGTVLVEILNKAAEEDSNSPFNRYESTYHAGLGRSITAVNGVQQDPETNTYWMIYDNKTGKYTLLGVDQYKPADDSVTVFRLESQNSAHKYLGIGALTLSALVATELLLVW
ncbi:uncharacterized protein [Montipora foliosa]|uniref:uncharacterized protein n=1 Tax=Montipora foliosa TaxID=591990 RepID=UPI0035F10936